MKVSGYSCLDLIRFRKNRTKRQPRRPFPSILPTSSPSLSQFGDPIFVMGNGYISIWQNGHLDSIDHLKSERHVGACLTHQCSHKYIQLGLKQLVFYDRAFDQNLSS
ncbi:MAG: hypothetical protein ACI8YQ_005068 [Polaribacter sp.]|jgi:hypothetical protein